MSQPIAEHEAGRWSADGYPWVIEYPKELMGRIRSAALDGYFRIARGGVEVGGVLFGEWVGKLVRIKAIHPLECVYATGPSFVLSEKDRQNLAELLASAAEDPELEGMSAVGWYHSHTRSEIFLSDADIEVHDQFFPEPWQVALVVRPERIKASRAGFFVRGKDGKIRGEASPREFLLETSVRLARPQAAPEVSPVRRAENAVPDLRVFRRPDRRQWLEWLVFTAALFLFLGGAALLAWSYSNRKPPEPLALRLLDHSGQLEVQWARSAAEVQGAESGLLEILDGEERSRIELTGGQLRIGTLTYARQSGTVHITLRVRRAGKDATETYAQFVGAPIEAAIQAPVNVSPPADE